MRDKNDMPFWIFLFFSLYGEVEWRSFPWKKIQLRIQKRTTNISWKKHTKTNISETHHVLETNGFESVHWESMMSYEDKR